MKNKVKPKQEEELYNRLNIECGLCDLQYSSEFDKVFDFIKKEKQLSYNKGREDNIEHCSEPKCPECNIVAYKKGVSDTLERVKREIKKEYSKDEYCYQTCIVDIVDLLNNIKKGS